MAQLSQALLLQRMRRLRAAVKLGPRLATVGARPVDKARLLLLGALLPVLERTHLFERRRARVRVRLQGSVVSIVLDDLSDYHVLAATRTGEVIPPFLESPKTIIDCGAHIGTASLQYSARFPEAAIYSVEPDPSTVERLWRNVEHVENVTIVQAAVGDRSGSGTFVQCTHSWSSSLTPPSSEPVSGQTVVATMTLSDLLDHCGVDEADLLKLDVEGAELDVLRDSDGLSRVRTIVGEIHYDLGQFSEHDLRTALKGFDVRLSPHSSDRALVIAHRTSPMGQASGLSRTAGQQAATADPERTRRP